MGFSFPFASSFKYFHLSSVSFRKFTSFHPLPGGSRCFRSYYFSRFNSLFVFIISEDINTAAHICWKTYIVLGSYITLLSFYVYIFQLALRETHSQTFNAAKREVWAQTEMHEDTHSNLISWREHLIQFTGWVTTASQAARSFGF